MTTALSTNFVCVATSGSTIDGRYIDPQDLKDMAQSYDPEVYTALIWLEHYRSLGNYGRVLALKTEQENGQTKLYAKISPNTQLLQLNQTGQKIFTSIEITPNFAKTGKAYLTGLAITDSPASTGTTALMFKRIGSNEVMLSDHLELDLSQAFASSASTIEQEKQSLRSRFFHWLFNFETPVPPANNGNPESTEITDMDKQEFSTLIATAVSEAVNKAFSAQAQQNAPTVEGEAIDEVPVENVSKQEFNELKSKYEALEAKFNQLAAPVTPTPSELGNVDKMFSLEQSGF